MMEPTRPSFDDDDADPAGIRDLLASVPEPGPMPDDVVARIETALRAEASGRGPAVVVAASHPRASGDTSAQVVDLASRRRPRWPRLLLGGAAAAAAVVIAATALPGFLSGFGSSTTAGSAAQPASAEARDDMKSGGTQGELGGGPPSTAPPQSPAAAAPLTVLRATSTREFTLDNWTTLVPATDTAFTAEAQSGYSALPGSTATISECLVGLKESPAGPVRVIVSSYAGRPAAVIVTDVGAAYLVDALCSATDPRIIASARLPG